MPVKSSSPSHAMLSPFINLKKLSLRRSQTYIEKTESNTSCNSYASDPTSRILRAVELQIASDARDDLRDHWKILPHSHSAQEGRKVFVASIPKFEHESDAILQICRVFLLEGLDLKHIRLLNGSAREQTSSNTDDYNYAFVDLMNRMDAKAAVAKLDGAVRMDSELLVSLAGLSEELMVGPLQGYQPRRKQVTEVRKLFKGFHVGEISLFYDLEPSAPALGEEIFEKSPRPHFYYCTVRLVDVDNLDTVIQSLNNSIWAGRQIFVRRPKLTSDGLKTQLTQDSTSS